MSKLNEAFQAASQEMYAAQGEQGGDGASGEAGKDAGGTGDEVTDVDFEEVSEEK